MMYQHYYLSLILFYLLFNVANSELYYITTSQDVQCPESSCLTLSEISSNTSHYIDGNNMTTLTFQPGNHSLDENLEISYIPNLTMLSDDTSMGSTNIVCNPSSRITFDDVSTIKIIGLNFIGCGRTSFTRSNNLTIWNSTFKGYNGSGTAIVVNNTTAGRIGECSFIFNTPRSNGIIPNFDHFDVNSSVRFGLQPNSTSSQLGGAILVLSSFIVIEKSIFKENEAQYGGAIYADQDSRIVINDCTFHRNRAVGLLFDSKIESSCGGALFVKNSKVDIYNSNFTNNSLIASSGCYANGGVLFAFNSQISAFQSDFNNNTIVTGNGTGGVIYASNLTSVTIRQCTFRSNEAHIAGVMYLQSSNASVNQSDFYNNVGHNQTGVIRITENSYTEFESCNFTDNTARTLGGVMYIASSNVIIDNNYFERNTVDDVGAVMVILDNAVVRVSASTLANNRANLAVMSIYNSTAVFSNNNVFMDNRGSLFAFNSTIYFNGDTTFSRCITTTTDTPDAILQEGGAVSAYSSHLIFQNRTLFVQNSAKYGGALFIVESTILLSAHLRNSEDTKMTIANNTATIAGGAIYLYHSFLTIRGSYLNILGNTATDKGGGIHAINSDILIEFQNGNQSLVLAENRAQLGGGLYLVGASRLSIPHTVNSMRLTGNTADYGGAIYVDDETKSDTCFTTPVNVTPASECFMNVIEPYKAEQTMPIDTHIQHITIEGNHAEQMGSDLFGGLLDRCRPNTLFSDIGMTLLTGTLIEEHDTDGLMFFQNISNIKDTKSISSRPMKVCFCVEGIQNCDLRELNVQARKGEIFKIPVVAVDQVESPVPSKIFSSISSNASHLASGQRAPVANICTNISYSIVSPYESENITLFAEGPCRNATPSQLTIAVTFSPCSCPIGFQHSANDTSCDCVCDPLISEHITKCDVAKQTFVRKTNSWIDYVIDNNQSTYIVSKRCPFRYCKGTPDAIEINLNNGFGANVQCSIGHTGTICGVCTTDFSVSLAHKRCLRCPDKWYFLFIGVCAGTILAGLGLVIAILALNFTVAVGTINGFIFYANIVDVYDSTFLPLSTSSFPVLIIEWLNLDPGFDICFVKGIDLYYHTWVRYVFPAYIIVIIIVIIAISGRSIRFSKLIGKRNPISTLATLLYLSFTNVLETAVVSLRPITLTYINKNGPREQTVWLPDGDLKYFHGKHIPMFLVAFILVLLTVAYITLLISWQWITGFSNLWILKWTKNQKIKRFMEAYHAPYCDKHRYWTGLLLLIRVLLILISITTEGGGPTIPLLSTIFCLGVIFLLRMTLAKKLYKNWPVELLETSLIFNLFVYAIFMWYALDELETRRIIAYISTSITFVLVLCVIAYHTYAYVLIKVFPRLRSKTMQKFRALTSPHATSPAINNIEIRDPDDRFHQMVGTMSMHSNHAVRSYTIAENRPISRGTHGPTFSVLETPYISAERDPETELSIVESETNNTLSTSL